MLHFQNNSIAAIISGLCLMWEDNNKRDHQTTKVVRYLWGNMCFDWSFLCWATVKWSSGKGKGKGSTLEGHSKVIYRWWMVDGGWWMVEYLSLMLYIKVGCHPPTTIYPPPPPKVSKSASSILNSNLHIPPLNALGKGIYRQFPWPVGCACGVTIPNPLAKIYCEAQARVRQG